MVNGIKRLYIVMIIAIIKLEIDPVNNRHFGIGIIAFANF